MIRRSLLALAAGAVVAAPAAAQAPLDLAKRPTPATLPTNAEIMQTIREITSHGPRRVGTEGGRFAVDYVRGKLREYGLTGVHVEETPTWAWESLRHGLTFAGQAIDSSPVIYSQSPDRYAEGEQSTPPGGLRAPLVDVGLATPAEVQAHDVEGKIVVFDLKFLLPTAGLLPVTEFLWDPDNTMLTSPGTLIQANPYITTFTDAVKAAMDGGAVGFVGVLADYFDSNDYYNEFYRKLVIDIPGLWVTKKEGARLRALMAANPGANASLDFASRRWKTKASAVVGYLEGASKDAIMVQSHHDSGFTGAVEDGSGVAEVLALAKHFAAQPAASREKSMMFTTFDSHFSGYHAHWAFGKRHITDRDPKRDPHRIVANVTLEHIAKAASIGSDGSLVVSDLPEPRGVFENLAPALKTELIGSIVRNDLRRTAVLNGSIFQPIGIPTDASGWVVAGIPTVSLIAGPMYLYDAADTLDKVLEDELQPIAQAFAEIIDAIDVTPSDSIGLLRPEIAEPFGDAIIEYAGGEKGTQESEDRPEDDEQPPGCTATAAGRPIAGARLRRAGPRTVLTFRARRPARVAIVATHRGGRRTVVARSKRLRACRRYRLELSRSVVAVRVAGVTVRRR